jgi:hypothetical protein
LILRNFYVSLYLVLMVPVGDVAFFVEPGLVIRVAKNTKKAYLQPHFKE